MPTYAYACTQCGHRFEVRQSFSDNALSECPECAGSVRKLFNTVGIVFKGSGFYRTDSRAGSDANGGAKEGSSASESSKGESAKGESAKGGDSSSAASGAKTKPADGKAHKPKASAGSTTGSGSAA